MSSSNGTCSGISFAASSRCSQEWKEYFQGAGVGDIWFAHMPTGQGRVGLFLLFSFHLEVLDRILVLRGLAGQDANVLTNHKVLGRRRMLHRAAYRKQIQS